MRNGVDYCRIFENQGKHSSLAFSILHAAGTKSLMHGYALKTSPEEQWAELFDYVRKSKKRRVVISTEEFARIGVLPDATQRLKTLIALAPQGINIRVIAYLRPPQEHLTSWYNQLVKMKIKTPNFNAMVSRFVEPIHFDYSAMLRPWIEACGAQNVIVHPYPGFGEDGRALYRDFLTTIGLDELKINKLLLPDEELNPRQRDDTLEVVRLMQNANFPRNMTAWTEARIYKHLQDQREIIPDTQRSFDAVVDRCVAGLDVLKDLPNSTVSRQQMVAKLPVPRSRRYVENTELQGVLMNEIYALRRRMDSQLAELYQRVAALEGKSQESASEPGRQQNSGSATDS